MTQALCFHCGTIKFGAICECPVCQVQSSGDMGLDIAFSDHRLDVKTLKEFGEVIKAIRQVCDEDDVRFWSFIAFVSAHHSEILSAQIPEEFAIRSAQVLAAAHPPPVVVEPSWSARMMQEVEERAAGEADEP